MFSLLRTVLPNEMLSFKRKVLRVLVLKLNEDPVREMTIRHAPQMRGFRTEYMLVNLEH